MKSHLVDGTFPPEINLKCPEHCSLKEMLCLPWWDGGLAKNKLAVVLAFKANTLVPITGAAGSSTQPCPQGDRKLWFMHSLTLTKPCSMRVDLLYLRLQKILSTPTNGFRDPVT